MIKGDITLFLNALGKKEGDRQFKKALAFVGDTYETDIYTDAGKEEKYLIMADKGVEFLLIDGLLSTVFFHTIESDEQSIYTNLKNLVKSISLKDTPDSIKEKLGTPLRATKNYTTYKADPGYIQFDFNGDELTKVVAMRELIGGNPAENEKIVTAPAEHDDLNVFIRAVGTHSYSPEHLAAVVLAGPAMESEKTEHNKVTWIYQNFPKSGVLFQFKDDVAVRAVIELQETDESPAYKWLDRLIPGFSLPASRKSIKAHFGEPFQSNEHMDLYYMEDRYVRFYFDNEQSIGVTISKPGADLQHVRDHYRQLDWNSGRNTKPTHITQMNGSSRGALRDDIRPYKDQMRFSLNRMNAESYWAYSLWRAPKDADLLVEIPLSDEYMQSAGTAEAMTIEIRSIDKKGIAHQYVVGKPEGDQTGTPTEEIRWNNNSSAIYVFKNEVFTADEAAEIYYEYFKTNKAPKGYSLRELNLNGGPTPKEKLIPGYIYTDKVGAGPEHPDKRWGLFSTELTPSRAAIRYGLNAVRRSRWFGIVQLKPGEDRPHAYLQICPRANGVELNQLNEYGSIIGSYIWRAYYTPAKNEAYTGDEDKVFLSSYTSYVYPKQPQFFFRNKSVGHVTLHFSPEGDIKQELIIPQGPDEPRNVEIEEYHGVDMKENWATIPEFGNWDTFFNPPQWDE